MHWEKKDADTNAADHWKVNVLPEILREYKPDDVCNADETGLYYRAIPEGTLTFKNQQTSGSKKAKERVTAMIATNMTGTDKRKLLVIGKSKDPRCFRGKKSLPVKYAANRNSWMTGEIFSEWIRDFNRDMCRQKRKVILFVDNCSAHPKESAQRLSNIRLEFLPPNTTSLIQPCDQGIIRNLKSSYRSELSANDLAKRVTLLDAIHMLRKAWNAVKSSTIQNCFRKAGFTADEHQADSDEENSEIPEGVTEEQFNELLRAEEDIHCHHVTTEEEICADIMAEESRDPEDDAEIEENEEFQLPVTRGEVEEALKIIRRFMEENSCDDFDQLYELEDKYDKKHLEKIKEGTGEFNHTFQDASGKEKQFVNDVDELRSEDKKLGKKIRALEKTKERNENMNDIRSKDPNDEILEIPNGEPRRILELTISARKCLIALKAVALLLNRLFS
ncbi:tigger transposable element-derived protein 4-like [Saccostrea echinata]|uniref:tigger transposable element-derived protein 4-like n=1 Tax=Saccostrea echinata TaxID=191078 RepID=UPI002A80F749|nr:tigger transposable element-derived protein 4-like [Saccostrea echinata]